MNNKFLLAILPLFLACTSQPEEVMDLEEIMPTAQYDKQEKKDTVVEVPVYQPNIDLELLSEHKIVWDSVAINEDLSVPERFKPTKVEKFRYYLGPNQVEYYSWNFADSSKSMKAFLNWMNCFGERCSMIELKQPNNIQRNAFLILQTDTTIIQIQSPTIGLTELKKWKETYTSAPESKWNYIIMQAKGGKSTWSQFVDEEETELLPLAN